MELSNLIKSSRDDAPISRKEAIELGAVIDLTKDKTRDMVLKMGFPFPIGITYPAFGAAILCAEDDRSVADGFSPGLFAVLQTLQTALRDSDPRDTIYFKVPKANPEKRPKRFKCLFELDEDGSGALTITTLDEYARDASHG